MRFALFLCAFSLLALAHKKADGAQCAIRFLDIFLYLFFIKGVLQFA